MAFGGEKVGVSNRLAGPWDGPGGRQRKVGLFLGMERRASWARPMRERGAEAQATAWATDVGERIWAGWGLG